MRKPLEGPRVYDSIYRHLVVCAWSHFKDGPNGIMVSRDPGLAGMKGRMAVDQGTASHPVLQHAKALSEAYVSYRLGFMAVKETDVRAAENALRTSVKTPALPGEEPVAANNGVASQIIAKIYKTVDAVIEQQLLHPDNPPQVLNPGAPAQEGERPLNAEEERLYRAVLAELQRNPRAVRARTMIPGAEQYMTRLARVYLQFRLDRTHTPQVDVDRVREDMGRQLEARDAQFLYTTVYSVVSDVLMREQTVRR